MLLPVETHLTDLSGEPVRYETVPFAFDEAFNLGLELANVLGGPIGEALVSLLQGDDVSEDALGAMDFGGIATAVTRLPERLLAAGGSEFVARILKTTTRYAKIGDNDGTGKPAMQKQSMGNAEHRTMAYSGGNLGECFAAIRWVLGVNYAPFLTAAWNEFQPRLAALMASGASIAELNPSETETP